MKESNIHAFGSDDMFTDERQQKKTISTTLESGKQALGKIGTFFTKSVKNIVKTDTEPSQTVQKDRDIIEPDNKNKFKDIGQDIKHISSKIGEGIITFGSKTKNLASQTGNFLKQKTNTMFNANAELQIKEDISDKGNKYKDYFGENLEKTANCNEYVADKDKSQDDVHFI